MRAWQLTEYGEPKDVLQPAELPTPAPRDGELLIRVLASSVNFADGLTCRGEYQVKPTLPFVPGLELCGEVVAVGSGVFSGRLGQRVVGSTIAGHGSFAQFALAKEDHVLLAPESLDDISAVAFFVGYQTGWFGLVRLARLAVGESLLVHAAVGGVGSAAIQLGKAMGAQVIAVAGGERKVDVARKLGADFAIDHRTEDFVAAVKEITAGRGADVIFDPVGGQTFTRSTKCIAFEGRIVVVGFASGDIPVLATNHALVKNYSVMGLHWGLYQDRRPDLVHRVHQRLLALTTRGLIDPLISERLGFEHIPMGVQHVMDGATVGRVGFQY
jgi:NADPH2:quinone reductase